MRLLEHGRERLADSAHNFARYGTEPHNRKALSKRIDPIHTHGARTIEAAVACGSTSR
jgi:hypothetical protein